MFKLIKTLTYFYLIPYSKNVKVWSQLDNFLLNKIFIRILILFLCITPYFTGSRYHVKDTYSCVSDTNLQEKNNNFMLCKINFNKFWDARSEDYYEISFCKFYVMGFDFCGIVPVKVGYKILSYMWYLETSK